MELAFLRGALQCNGGGVRVHRGGNAVEVTGTDFALVLDGGESALLGSLELAVLQVHEGRHLLACVTVGQVKHRVVQRVETSQGDELELEAHLAQLVLELRDLVLLQVRGPVERRRAVVRQQLVGELLVHTVGELLGQLQIRRAGLHPDEVRVGGVGLGARNTRLDPVLNVVVPLRSTVARDELLVALVDVRGN